MLLENEKEIGKNGEMERNEEVKWIKGNLSCRTVAKVRRVLGQITAVSALNGTEWAGSRL